MMDYKTRLTIKKDADMIYGYIKPEMKNLSRDRCTLKIKKTKDSLVFEISAKDITSLKASSNSIINSIEIFNKTKDLVEDEQGDRREGQ
jgi:tRNA threonylcarbamoyladenosine modification (KEOPS) complex  Pcc1 subunit